MVAAARCTISPYLLRSRRSLYDACHERCRLHGAPPPDCDGCLLGSTCRPVRRRPESAESVAEDAYAFAGAASLVT